VVDTSAFFTKAESDSRFVGGDATLTTARGSYPLRPDCCGSDACSLVPDVSGFGRFQLSDCAFAGGNITVEFANTTNDEVQVFSGDSDVINASGSIRVAAGASNDVTQHELNKTEHFQLISSDPAAGFADVILTNYLFGTLCWSDATAMVSKL
jgi:hypothetical protein